LSRAGIARSARTAFSGGAVATIVIPRRPARPATIKGPLAPAALSPARSIRTTVTRRRAARATISAIRATQPRASERRRPARPEHPALANRFANFVASDLFVLIAVGFFKPVFQTGRGAFRNFIQRHFAVVVAIEPFKDGGPFRASLRLVVRLSPSRLHQRREKHGRCAKRVESAHCSTPVTATDLRKETTCRPP
jgi:hypothetical protein